MQERTLTAFGEEKTFKEWSKTYGVSSFRIGQRLRKGWTPEDAVSKPLQPGEAGSRQEPMLIEYKGEKRKVSEWRDILDISETSIRKGIKRGWDMEKIISSITAYQETDGYTKQYAERLKKAMPKDAVFDDGKPYKVRYFVRFSSSSGEYKEAFVPKPDFEKFKREHPVYEVIGYGDD